MPRKAKPADNHHSEAVEAALAHAPQAPAEGGRRSSADRGHQREDPPADPPLQGAGLPDVRRHQRGAARVGREPGGDR